MKFENTDRLFAWYDENETVCYDKDAVLEEVVCQYDNNGMLWYESKFSDGHIALYRFDVIERYIVNDEVVCTVDADGVHGVFPDDWDDAETIYIF